MRRIVCLCGSTRFSKEYQEANLRETLDGNIVLTIGCDMKSDHALFAGKSEQELATIKENLDNLHRSKIELAWAALILNVGGYVGESTRSEIEWAYECRKHIRWLEPQWVRVTETIAFFNETVVVGTLGLLHPDGEMVHYPDYPEPRWRSFGGTLGLKSHEFISSTAVNPRAKIYDVRDFWLKECRSAWVKEYNSPEGEKGEG